MALGRWSKDTGVLPAGTGPPSSWHRSAVLEPRKQSEKDKQQVCKLAKDRSELPALSKMIIHTLDGGPRSLELKTRLASWCQFLTSWGELVPNFNAGPVVIEAKNHKKKTKNHEFSSARRDFPCGG